MTKLIQLDDELGSVGIELMSRESGPSFGYQMDLSDFDGPEFDPVSFLESGYTHYYQDPGDDALYFFFTTKEYREILSSH